MKTRFKIILLASTIFGLSQAHASSGAGNGGDTVSCNTSAKYENRVYFLDYLAARMANPGSEYFTNTDVLIENLRMKAPGLAGELEKISQAYINKKRNGPYVWQAVIPKDISDEEIFFELPKGCDTIPTQLIRRQRASKTRAYFYFDEVGMEQIEDHESWAFAHELLWEAYDSAFNIRMVNEFIHNKANYSLSSDDFIEELNVIAQAKGGYRYMNYQTKQVQLKSEDLIKKYSYLETVGVEVSQDINELIATVEPVHKDLQSIFTNSYFVLFAEEQGLIKTYRELSSLYLRLLGLRIKVKMPTYQK